MTKAIFFCLFCLFSDFSYSSESREKKLPSSGFNSESLSSQSFGFYDQDLLKSSKKEKAYKYYNYEKNSPEILFFGKVPEQVSHFKKMVSDPSTYYQVLEQIDEPLHYLFLFGSPGSGKSTLAHQIAYDAKLKLYEIDFKGAPLQLQLKMAMQDFADLVKYEVRGASKKILLIKGMDPEFPLYQISEIPEMHGLFDQFFVVATYDCSEDEWSVQSKIKKSKALFQAKINKPKLNDKFKILENYLQGKNHDLSKQDLRKLARFLNDFNGHLVKRVINESMLKCIFSGSTLRFENVVEVFNSKKVINPVLYSMYN